MNLLTNLRIFSSFGTMVKLLSGLITVMKIMAGLLLGIQVISVLVKMKKNGLPMNQILKLS